MKFGNEEEDSEVNSDASFASSDIRKQPQEQKKRKEDEGDSNKTGEADGELFDQEKSFQEVLFMTLNILSSEKAFLHDWRVNTAKVILEGLTGFLVVFNPLVKGWSIDTGLWFWQIITWATYYVPIAYDRGYEVYIRVMYVHVALVFLLSLAFGGLILATVRKVALTKNVKKAIKVLQFCMDVVFSVLFMTIFSVFIFMFDCNFASSGMHVHYSSIDCTAVPHIAHMIVAGMFALIQTTFSIILAVSDCELSPVSRYPLATPAAVMRVKIVVAKLFILICAVAINSSRKAPVIIIWIFALYTWWLYFRNMPYYNRWVSHAISSMWLGIAYTASLLMIGTYNARNDDPAWHTWMTWSVLKGIFPVVAGSAVCQWVMLEYKMSKTKKFKNQPPNVVLRKIHKFYWEPDVELMARVMRKFDLDGNLDPQAVDLGELIIRAGIAYFPNNPNLLMLHAIVLLELKHEGPIARSLLQAAAKLKPNIISRYQLFTVSEKAKKLRNAGEGILDLQSYVEYKRNYRGLVRVHKKVLKAQHEFWKLFMHSSTKVGMVRTQLATLEAVAERAQYAYRKIMERYPNNGKVLKCYGKFLEEVKNDISSASRFYSEGNRIGSTDAMMNMNFDFAAQKKMDLLVNMNLHEDAVIIIDAVGTILMTSQGAVDMFGWSKRELEAANVSMLMPQPFSLRHPSYLTRYTSTGEPHILDMPQQVVAIHKDKFVFPVDLGVTKLSGSGSDSIFLGVLKPCPASMGSVRVWVSPSGFVLCCDQQFSGLVGLPAESMVGRQLSSLVVDVAGIDSFLEKCRAAPSADFASNRLTASVHFVNKYLPPIPATFTAKLNGTNLERVFELNVERRIENEEMMMVCDKQGTITFTTWDMAALVGVNTQKLLGSKLEALLPPPYNSMHAKWLQDTPPTIPSNSCRAGVVVQLLNSSNVLVPVRIRVHSMEENKRIVHVIRVRKVSPNELLDDKRINFTVNLSGVITAVEPENSLLFGWPVDGLKGEKAANVVDLVSAWRQRVADAYHGGSVERCLAETGTGGCRVLVLSFIENELAHPGSSFRVALKPPHVDFAAANAAAQKTCHQGATLQELLHNKANTHMLQASRRAVMMPEVVEVDGLPALKLHMYKQDNLTGYLEMETDLSIRKADVWASLIFGMPSSLLTHKKLHDLLHVDKGSRWEDLMGIEEQTGGLTRMNRGTVTAPRSFIADHGDGGTVRVTLQGVSKSEGLGHKNRIEATLHTDTSYYQGSPYVIFEQLGLNNDEEGQRIGSKYKHFMEGLILSRQRFISAKGNPRPGSSYSTAGRAAGSRRASQNGDKERRVSSNGREKRISSGSGMSGRLDLQEGLAMKGKQLSGLQEGDEEEGSLLGSSGAVNISDGGVAEGSLQGVSPTATQFGGALMQGSDGNDEDGGREEDDEERAKDKKKEAVAQWIQSIAAFNKAEDEQRAPTPEDKPKSRARPTLISIDEDGNEQMLESKGFVPRPFQPRLAEHGREAGLDSPLLMDEEALQGQTDTDWERQVADMPDEAAVIEAQDEAKSKGKRRSGTGEQPANPGNDGRSESSGGDGGTGIDSASVVSGNSAHDEILVDSRRGRLLKKLVVLIRGPCLMVPLTRLAKHSLFNILAIVIVHVIFFALFFKLSSLMADNMNGIYRHGQAIDWSQVVYYRAVRLDQCLKIAASGQPIPDLNICAKAKINPDSVAEDLQTAVEDFNTYQQDVYLGPPGVVHKIVSPRARMLWNNDDVNVLMYYNITPPTYIQQLTTLWEAGNRLTYAARELQVAFTQSPLTIGNTSAFYYVHNNALDSIFNSYVLSIDYLSRYNYDSQGELATTLIVFLIVESVVVLTLLHLYQLSLIIGVERARLGGLLAMVGLPVPVLKLMLDKPLVILDDDSDEEQEEEEGPMAENKPRNKQEEEEDHAQAVETAKDAARWSFKSESKSQKMLAQGPTSGASDAGGSEAGNVVTYSLSKLELAKAGRRLRNPFKLTHQLRLNSKNLVLSWGKVVKMMLPFFLWQLAVLVVWAVTITMVEDIKGPIISLSLAMRVAYRFSHVRATALTLVFQNTTEAKNEWKSKLNVQVEDLTSVYDALLYGGVPKTLEGTVFDFDAPAVAFDSQEFKANFFQNGMCFRLNKSTCLPPSSQYYQISRDGLDAMMQRMLSELRLLITDNDTNINYLSSSVDYMHQIGSNDISDGLQTTADLFAEITNAKFVEVQNLQIALLAITLVLAFMYTYFVLWPYEKAVKHEASQVAGLLSHTPKEMDIRKHLQAALKKTS